MLVLVFGGREFKGDVSCLEQIIRIDILIHGGCRGADMLADAWARSRGIHTARVDALWVPYGRNAGFIRNKAMLLLKPDVAVGFPGGPGSASMKKLCLQNNIPLWEPYSKKEETLM